MAEGRRLAYYHQEQKRNPGRNPHFNKAWIQPELKDEGFKDQISRFLLPASKGCDSSAL